MLGQLLNKSVIGSLVIEGKEISSIELYERIARVVSGLGNRETQNSPDTFLPVIIDDSVESQVLVLALAVAQVNCALIDANTPQSLLEKIFAQLNPSVVAVRTKSLNLKTLGVREISMEDLEDSLPSDSLPIKSGEGSLIVFSSGSTGSPKGVKILWSTVFNWLEMRDADTNGKPSTESALVHMSPISWLTGTLSLLAVLKGTTVHYLNPLKMSPQEILGRLGVIKPTTIYLTSHLAEALARALKIRSWDRVDSIEFVMIGGTSLNWSTLYTLRALFSESAVFMHPLGASEAFRMFVFSCPLNQAPESGRVPIGAPRDPRSVRLSQETSEKDVFEVLASGDIASGYLDPKQTIARFETDRQGVRWWRSGDLVKIDPETGLYFHAGRKDDFVKVNDHNVSLGDLEAALLENPAVIAAAAIAVELNDRLRIVAFVELNEETALDKVALLRTLRERLPSYAMPHDVHMNTKIPLTRTGKPDRVLMRDIAQGISVPTGEPVSD